jgi:hypothetical protein
MPWWLVRNLTDDDLKAVFAYLRTLQPVHHWSTTPSRLPSANSVVTNADGVIATRGGVGWRRWIRPGRPP